MPDVSVRRAHSLTAEEAKGRLAPFEEKVAEWGLTVSWRGMVGALKGPGIKGTIVVDARDVAIELSMGFAAKLVVKPAKVTAELNKKLAETYP